MLGQAGSCSPAQGIEVTMAGDTDDRQVEAFVANEAGQGGEYLLVGEISGRAEENEGVGAFGSGLGVGRGYSFLSSCPPKP
jgi:hypothetical protein